MPVPQTLPKPVSPSVKAPMPVPQTLPRPAAPSVNASMPRAQPVSVMPMPFMPVKPVASVEVPISASNFATRYKNESNTRKKLFMINALIKNSSASELKNISIDRDTIFHLLISLSKVLPTDEILRSIDQALIKKSTLLEVKDQYGETPLVSLLTSSLDSAKKNAIALKFIEAGAPIYISISGAVAKIPDGANGFHTVLTWAIENRNEVIFDAVLKKAGDQSIVLLKEKNSDLDTPLPLLLGITSINPTVKKRMAIKMIELGAPITGTAAQIVSGNGVFQSPLAWTIERRNKDIFDAIINKATADGSISRLILEKDSYHETPLEIALGIQPFSSMKDMIAILINCGARVTKDFLEKISPSAENFYKKQVLLNPKI